METFPPDFACYFMDFDWSCVAWKSFVFYVSFYFWYHGFLFCCECEVFSISCWSSAVKKINTNYILIKRAIASSIKWSFSMDSIIRFLKIGKWLIIVISFHYHISYNQNVVDEHLAELMPIFERLRQQEQIPCAFPLHMGAGGTAFVRNTSRLVALSPHTPHCHPSTHWVSYCVMLLNLVLCVHGGRAEDEVEYWRT